MINWFSRIVVTNVWSTGRATGAEWAIRLKNAYV